MALRSQSNNEEIKWGIKVSVVGISPLAAAINLGLIRSVWDRTEHDHNAMTYSKLDKKVVMAMLDEDNAVKLFKDAHKTLFYLGNRC